MVTRTSVRTVILTVVLVLSVLFVAGSKAIYPLDTPVTLKYWAGLNPNVAQTAKNLGDTPFGKELQKRTGVNVEYIHPAMGQDREAFNIMIASGDLPDIIEYNWYADYPGGPENAIKQDQIHPLNKIITKYAPNLRKYLRGNPAVDKMIKTDSGNYYVFPFIRGDDLLMVFYGPMFRKDWLDELGLQVPSTVDEWYTVLKAFKEKKGATVPLTLRCSPIGDLYVTFGGAAFLAGAYGVNRGFYVEKGKIKYGPIEPGYKAFLTTLRKWYAEGLVDRNFPTADVKAVDANMLGGVSGATVGYAGGSMGKWLGSMRDKDAKFNLVAAPYPVLKKGEKPKFGQRDFAYSTAGCVAISTKCKNVEAAARFLDYGYSPEGHMLFNFGIEGISYRMEGDFPRYTDLLMNNPDKLPVANAMSRYIRANYLGPFVQDKNYILQYLAFPQQKEAVKIWANTDAAKYNLPRITSTPDESSQMAKIMNDVQTFSDEMFLKFVMGVEPLENYDSYVAKIKSLGIDKAIALQQAALARYNKR